MVNEALIQRNGGDLLFLSGRESLLWSSPTSLDTLSICPPNGPTTHASKAYGSY